MANKVLTKAEIFRRMERYLDDPEKIISVSFMAELAGCEEHTVYKIFRQKNMPLSERMQIRFSSALQKLERGEVRVMRYRDKTRQLHYVKEPRPVTRNGYSLNVTGGKIGISVGPQNRGDYSQPTFEEKMKWRS
jgi:hypothetical protein